jgi:hypothetical protein
MSGGININVSGGQAQFGNLIQGDNNTVTSNGQNLTAPQTEAFETLLAALNGRPAGAPDDEIERLKADIAELRAAIKTQRPTRWGSIEQGLKIIKDAYGWAAPLLTPLIKVLAPGLPF